MNELQKNVGQEMYEWATDLFPLNRSLSGEGVRETLRYLQNILPDLKICGVPSGQQAFDWEVPEEWEISEAFIEDESGNRLVDFATNNLHVVGYSTPVDEWMTLEELQKNLYSIPDQPDAIPYITSYYKKRWGFCLSHHQRTSLKNGKYHVVIRSRHFKGELNYGELIIPGESKEEVFFSTYVCHPSLANNEISGPVVTTALARWIQDLEQRRFTYRMVFIPETIGSLMYLSKHLKHLQQNVKCGYVISCVGDDRTFSHVRSRMGNNLSDKVLTHVLKHYHPEYNTYSWLERGSDERQYCAPGVDLPMAGFCRTKYGKYPEYHTSLDNLELISPEGLNGSLEVLQHIVSAVEANEKLKVTVLGEPQLGKRGLYPTLSEKGTARTVRTMMNLISFCDGQHSLLEIAEKISAPVWELVPVVTQLKSHGLLIEENSAEE